MKKENQFHGEYLPGQGKTTRQYENSVKIIIWIVVVTFAAGLVFLAANFFK